MPEKQQEIARFPLQQFLEEGVLVGVGVLLVFLGLWSKVPITNFFGIGVGAFLFYVVYRSYHGKTATEEETDGDDDDADARMEEANGGIWKEEPEEVRTEQRIAVANASREIQKQFVRTQPLVDERTIISMSTIEPQSEFNNLLTKVLRAVKEACFAHTVAFFWINNETQQLVVEAKISDSESFVPERKLPIGNDEVSRIAVHGKAEIINQISSETERDVLCYYKSLQDVKSFIGMPIYYAYDGSAQQPIGVLAVDSKAEDSFGEETTGILNHFSQLISALLISHTEKYELLSERKLVEADVRLRKQISSRSSVASIVNAFSGEVEHIVGWDSISVVLFDDTQHAWTIASVKLRGSDKFVAAKQIIDFDDSVVGIVLRTSMVQTLDLSQKIKNVFHGGEHSSELLKNGSLLVVPFVSNGKCFGAVTMTNVKPNFYSKKDIAAIEYLSSTVAASLEVLELNSIIAEHISVDEPTGTMRKKHFLARLNEEIQRANDRNEDLALVFVSLHNAAEIEQRYGIEGKESALVGVAKQLRVHTRLYDVIGRFDEDTFAVALADTIASDAYLWAEKLRTAIATTIVSVDKKSFSFAVTIGISGAGDKTTSDELVKNAHYVLDQAKKSGGNLVRVF